MTKADVDAIAKKTLQPETMTIIVVGHAYKIRESLNKLGYGKVKEITLD
jgi:predicted Zn-dependent peptidase